MKNEMFRLSTFGLLTLLFTAGCGVEDHTPSQLNASVSRTLEKNWGGKIDLSKEHTIEDKDWADGLKATRSSVKSVKLGAGVIAGLQFGSSLAFNVGPGLEFAQVFERRLLNTVGLLRMKDLNGTEDGRGLFVDPNTVAAHNYIHCTAEKVITQSSNLSPQAHAGVSFMGLTLSTGVEGVLKVEASTDYAMNRGYYETKVDIKLSDIFDFCTAAAMEDIALQHVDRINKTVKMNFKDMGKLEDVAKDVARGKKVNNFLYEGMKFDFEIRKRESNLITYEVHPDTRDADPRLEVSVHYKTTGDFQRIAIESIDQVCVSHCETYRDDDGHKHGLHSYGPRATVDKNSQAIKLLASIFTASALAKD